MKFLLPLLCLLYFVSCSSDRFYYPNGKLMASMQGDYRGVDLTMGKHLHLQAAEINHSNPTLAGGQAFKLGADSVGTTVVSGIMAGGLPWAKAAAGATQIGGNLLQPATQIVVPAVLQSKH